MIGASPIRIVSAANDVLVDDCGRRFVDLFAGHGTAFLGHANPAIGAAVARQLERVWITGGLDTPALLEARERVESFLPASHRLALLYSTGMEAAEFALRLARGITGRAGAIGFAGSMHGKSLATASLGWEDGTRPAVAGVHRLAAPPEVTEDETLARLDATLRAGATAAVFVEPIRASAGGHAASPRFLSAVVRLCHAHGALSVVDEILTGFHRTGPPFVFSAAGVVPDAVLIGKAIGNGFPVAGVVLDRRHAVTPAMLPGSTYAGNPLAAAAVVATLTEMRTLDVPRLVGAIARALSAALAPFAAAGCPVRGAGAMWFVELPSAADAERLVVRLYTDGVAAGQAGRWLRFLPPATIEPANLQRACAIVSAAASSMRP